MTCTYCDWYRLWLRNGTSQPVYNPAADCEPPVPEEIRAAWTDGCEPYLADQGWMLACDAISKLVTDEDQEESGYTAPFSRVRHKMLRLSDEEILSELRNMVSESIGCPTCSREPGGMTSDEAEFFGRHLIERSTELSRISPQELGQRLCSQTPERDHVNYALTQILNGEDENVDPALRPIELAGRAEIWALHDYLNSPRREVQCDEEED